MTDLDPHREAGYLALGRFFAEFSNLFAFMLLKMSQYLQAHGIDREISRLPFGVMTADQLASVFFHTARILHEHDPKEVRIAKKLRKALGEEIAFRNDAAHGEWVIGLAIPG